MKLHIGEEIHKRLKDARISKAAFADMLHMNRSNAYDIFKRESIDTELLARICETLKFDFFALYSKNMHTNAPGVLEEPATEYAVPPKRKIMIEVSLTEKEFNDLVRKKL